METENSYKRSNIIMDREYFKDLVLELCKQPESEWLEFKQNWNEPEKIGELISGISNSAFLEGKNYGYVVWGIEDNSQKLVGTKFNPSSEKGKGNEDLIPWLKRNISPSLDFEFFKYEIEKKHIVLLRIPVAEFSPTQFKELRWIRIESYQQKLNDHQDIEAKIWKSFDTKPFEERFAIRGLDGNEVENLIDIDAYFNGLGNSKLENLDSNLNRLEADGLIKKDDASRWNITNMGFILLAKDISKIGNLEGKTIRLIQYNGKGRTERIKEHQEKRGYVLGTSEIINLINNMVPDREEINGGKSRLEPKFPELPVRELIVNALVHQDFSDNTRRIRIEIFEDRMEITNPGKPLINIDRFLDEPPQSRNPKITRFMHRVGLSEDLGSGVDKVVKISENKLLPPPLWELYRGSVRVTLFSSTDYRLISKQDRLRGCYLHSCLKYTEKEPMTNSSLRERFGLKKEKSYQISRLISEALDDGLIKPFGPGKRRRDAKYLPWWAQNQFTN